MQKAIARSSLGASIQNYASQGAQAKWKIHSASSPTYSPEFRTQCCILLEVSS
jgi:hypothetical protein